MAYFFDQMSGDDAVDDARYPAHDLGQPASGVAWQCPPTPTLLSMSLFISYILWLTTILLYIFLFAA